MSDLIEREKAIRCATRYGLGSLTIGRHSGTADIIAAEIENLPTVDAVPVVHGHFEYDIEAGEYICSVCGHMTCGYLDMESEHFAENEGHGWRLRQPHYCKHCGAKMDEVVE